MAELPAAGGAASPELTVVLPTRNEAGNVEPLLARLRLALRGLDYELLFVDDSDDGTESLLARQAGADARLHLLHRDPKDRGGGLSTAVVLGLNRARGRLVCVMDSDLQHPPETIPAMLAAEAEGADLVVASRYRQGGSRAGLDGGARHLVSRAASLLARALFIEARASTDPLAGFFLCRRSLLRGLEFRPVGFKILLELLVCVPQAKVAEVPLRFSPRAAGESKASAAQGVLFLRHLWSLVWDVPGSARTWKFALVGGSGLLLFLLLLELGGILLGWPLLAAWAVAFVVSLGWNFAWNLRLTFADLRRERYPLMRRYVSSALTSGGAQLVVFLGLTGTDLPLLLDGLLAAVVGMAVNGTLNWQLAARHRQPQTQPLGLDRFLGQLQRAARADGARLLDRGGRLLGESGLESGTAASLRSQLAERAGRTGVPVLWVEPPSGRPQARSNVELDSLIVLPLELPGHGPCTLALGRHSSSALGSADLEAAMRQLVLLRPRLGAEPSRPAAGVAAGSGASPAQ